MAVTHAFVSAKSDGGDATVVRPSNWNADHVITSYEVVNSTTAQGISVYNTYTDASNYERGVFNWTTTANWLTIGAQAAGTGTLRSTVLMGPKLAFGGTSSSFVAIRDEGGSAGTLGVVKADESQYAPVSASSFNAVGSIFNVSTLYLNHASATVQFGASGDPALMLSSGALEINSSTIGTRRDLKLRDITITPSASLTPANNGELVIQATSNTSLTFKYKGSDGTVRSASLTLT